MPLAAAELNVPSLTGPGKTSATFKGLFGSTCATDTDACDTASPNPTNIIAANFSSPRRSVIVSLHCFLGAAFKSDLPVLPKRTQAPSARAEANLACTVRTRAKVLHGLREAVTLLNLHRRLASACQCPGVFH